VLSFTLDEEKRNEGTLFFIRNTSINHVQMPAPPQARLDLL